MRTTLTLDDDVAALLRQVQEQRKVSLKEVVNCALRDGLVRMNEPTEPRKRFHTPTIVHGPRTIENIDNIAEVLSIVEGDDRR